MTVLDLYAVLELDKTATARQIKDAYRSLVKKHHPDVGGDRAKFEPLAVAYAVLSDADKRAHYDVTGEYEDGAEYDLRQAVLSLISQIFSDLLHALNVPLSQVNLLAKIKETLNGGLATGIKQQATLTRGINELQALIGDIQTERSDDDNIFVKIINNRIQELQAKLQQTEVELQVMEAAVAEMAHYTSVDKFVRYIVTSSSANSVNTHFTFTFR